MVNSLGIFENQAVYKKLLAMLHLIGQMYQGGKLEVIPLHQCAGSNNSPAEEEKKEDEDQQVLTEQTLQSSGILFTSDETENFDYAGLD